MTKIIADREAQWEETKLAKIRLKFPLRIQKVLEEHGYDICTTKNVGESIFYVGVAGTGKSVLAASYLLQFEKKAFVERKYVKTEYVTVVDFLKELRNTYNSKSSEATEMEVWTKYTRADLVVFDDLGVEKMTDWAYGVLYGIIAFKYDNMQPMVCTSNLSLEALAERLGDDRITSRLQHQCKIIKLNKVLR